MPPTSFPAAKAPRQHAAAILAVLSVALGGCELPGMGDSVKVEAAKEAEGRAIGGACRQSGRALEDCYVMNPKAQKAAIYGGWRDMDTYMRENKIETVTPDLVDAPTAGKGRAPAAASSAPTDSQATQASEAKPEAADRKPATDAKGAARHSASEGPHQGVTPRRFG